MSVTHLVFGSVAVKSRSRWLRTYAGRVPLRLRRHCRRWGMPYSPFRAMSRAMRLRLAVSPSWVRTSCIRGMPITLSLAVWYSRMRLSRRRLSLSLVLMGLLTQP